MKRHSLRYLSVLLTGFFTVFFLIPQAHAIIIFTNEFLSNEGEIAVIDSDGNAAGSITLKFGQTANQTLVWDITNSKFVLSNNLIVNGTLGTNGNTFTLDADNVGAAADVNIVAEQGLGNDGTLRYNAAAQRWEISNNGGAFNAIATGSAGNAFVQNGNSFAANGVLGTNDNFPLIIRTNGTESMRIAPNGQVGIGSTTLPASKLLTVSNTAAPTFNATGNGMGVSMAGGGGVYMKNSTDNVEAKFESYAGSVQIGVSSSVQAPLLLSYDNAFPGARLDTNGHFTIGQATGGSYRLDVQNSGAGLLDVQRLQNNQAAVANNGSAVLFAANRTTGGMTNIAGLGAIITDIANAAYKGALIFQTANNGAPAERMRIDHLGNVGINATSLSDKFTVVSSADTTSLNNTSLDYVQGANVANITGAGLNIAVTPSGEAGDTIRGININAITGTNSTEEGINIGAGFDRDIRFNDANVTVAVPDNVNMSLLDTSGNNMMIVRDLSATGGAYSEIGASLDRNSYIAEEFMRERADITADAAMNWGDIQGFGTDENTNCTFSTLDDTVNGIGRIAATAAGNCLAYQSSATAGNAHLIFNTSNLPVILMKVKPTNVSANDDLWVGIGTDAAASNTPPTSGVFFTNNDGANWVGITRNASTSTTVACGVAASTSQFALLKIEVRSTNDVRFYVDADVSNGISWTTCGTSTTNIPTANLTSMLKLNSTTAGRALDIDFFRAWQF